MQNNYFLFHANYDSIEKSPYAQNLDCLELGASYAIFYAEKKNFTSIWTTLAYKQTQNYKKEGPKVDTPVITGRIKISSKNVQ